MKTKIRIEYVDKDRPAPKNPRKTVIEYDGPFPQDISFATAISRLQKFAPEDCTVIRYEVVPENTPVG